MGFNNVGFRPTPNLSHIGSDDVHVNSSSKESEASDVSQSYIPKGPHANLTQGLAAADSGILVSPGLSKAQARQLEGLGKGVGKLVDIAQDLGKKLSELDKIISESKVSRFDQKATKEVSHHALFVLVSDFSEKRKQIESIGCEFKSIMPSPSSRFSGSIHVEQPEDGNHEAVVVEDESDQTEGSDNHGSKLAIIQEAAGQADEVLSFLMDAEGTLNIDAGKLLTVESKLSSLSSLIGTGTSLYFFGSEVLRTLKAKTEVARLENQVELIKLNEPDSPDLPKLEKELESSRSDYENAVQDLVVVATQTGASTASTVLNMLSNTVQAVAPAVPGLDAVVSLGSLGLAADNIKKDSQEIKDLYQQLFELGDITGRDSLQEKKVEIEDKIKEAKAKLTEDSLGLLSSIVGGVAGIFKLIITFGAAAAAGVAAGAVAVLTPVGWGLAGLGVAYLGYRNREYIADAATQVVEKATVDPESLKRITRAQEEAHSAKVMAQIQLRVCVLHLDKAIHNASVDRSPGNNHDSSYVKRLDDLKNKLETTLSQLEEPVTEKRI